MAKATGRRSPPGLTVSVAQTDTRGVDSAGEWIAAHCRPTGPSAVVRSRVWATTTRIPTADGPVWFKACAPSHRFEAELVPSLARCRPELLPRVLAHDAARGWLLTADAGTSFRQLGNPPELWLRLLPRYAELQRDASVPGAVPDRTLPRWPELYDELVASALPLEPAEAKRLGDYAPRFASLCEELAGHGLPATVQHDDLHDTHSFVDGDVLRMADWGDASLSHPFVSLVVTFRFLEERSGLVPADPWFAKLRDAYLEPWGPGLVATFDLAQRLGRFVHAFGWVSPRRLLPAEERPAYDVPFRTVLRRALSMS
jgi:Phosphotransferase enzyme family